MSEFLDTLGASNWKADVETNNKGTNKVPQVMKDLPQIDPSRKELTNDELKEAKKDLYNKEFVRMKYHRDQKYRVDPAIPGQTYGLISFIPSQNATPDEDGCYGVMKFRGAFSNSAEAETVAEMIFREYDSLNPIDVCFIGREFPLLKDNSMYCKTTREIDIRKKVDDIVRADTRAKKEKEQKDIEDVTTRQQRLLDKTHSDEKEEIFEDLDYYTMLRVKKAQCLGLIDEAKKRIQEAEDVLNTSNEEISKLDESHPEYKEKFLQKYQDALASVGSDLTENPLIKYLA
jgi:hypothetical protein